MLEIVKMPITDWLPYPPPLYINIGFGLSYSLVRNFNIWGNKNHSNQYVLLTPWWDGLDFLPEEKGMMPT